MQYFFRAMCLIVLTVTSARSAYAQDDTPPPPDEVTDDDVNAIAEQLYCPVCENIPLDVCGTQACADWRSEIRAMLEQGRSEEEIKAYFVNRYGERVLAAPEARGINALFWALPPLLILIGAAVLVIALRRMAPGSLVAPAGDAPSLRYEGLDPEYVAQVERDLKDYAG